MKTKAAVATAARKPLEIITVDLDGPESRRSPGGNQGQRRLSHGRVYPFGGGSRGVISGDLGHEGAGIVVDVGPGVTSVRKGDHVIPLYTPECRQCKSCTSRKTNLCTAIRATQGKGLMPDGTSRFSIGKDLVHHYMGCSTFSNFTVLPEIARRENPRGRALRQGVLHRLRRDHGHRRGDQHRQGGGGRQRGGVRPGRHRPQCGAGRAHGGREQDHRRGLESRAARRWPRNSA